MESLRGKENELKDQEKARCASEHQSFGSAETKFLGTRQRAACQYENLV